MKRAVALAPGSAARNGGRPTLAADVTLDLEDAGGVVEFLADVQRFQ